MRLMGLDVGEKRVGIALSDPLGWTAQSYAVMPRASHPKEVEYLQKICTEFTVEKLIFGLPINMNGTKGDKAREIEFYAERMVESLKLPYEWVDERLTTKSAQDLLISADVSRGKRKQVVDKMAAAYILQIYLDKITHTNKN